MFLNIKAVMFCDSNYAKNKETRNSVRDIVYILEVALIMCSSNTQNTITLSSTDDEYVALSTCTQYVKFVNMLLEEMSEIQKPENFMKIIKGVFS